METMPFSGPGFEMHVPTNWLIQATPQHQAIFLSPPRKDLAGASLVVDMQMVEDKVTLKDVSAMLKAVRQKVVPKAEVILEEESSLDRRPAWHTLYRYQHPETKQEVVQRIIALVVDGMMISLTASRPAGKQAEMDSALAIMIGSFTFR